MRMGNTKFVNKVSDDDEVNAKREQTMNLQTPKFPPLFCYVYMTVAVVAAGAFLFCSGGAYVARGAGTNAG